MHKYNIRLLLTWLFHVQTCQEFVVTLMATVEQCRIQHMLFPGRSLRHLCTVLDLNHLELKLK